MTIVANYFGSSLRRYRKDRGLSQEELSFRSAVHRTAVGELERGARIPHLDTVVKLAGGLAITPAELLGDLRWTDGTFHAGRYEE